MQMYLDLPAVVPKSAYAYGERSSGDTHGVVLTKKHVVELILDLAGYTSDRDLTALRLLEPSCGKGAFLVVAIRRLLASATRAGSRPSRLKACVAAFDIDEAHVASTRGAVVDTLMELGVPAETGRELAEAWVRVGDFLLEPFEGLFDVVVGNPPYVRIEQLSEILTAEYRRRYASLYDRADLYVAFIERSLTLLSPDGLLSFICADRWILNKYGAPLRKIVSTSFRLKCYIDLHNAAPFESDVIAYPSIFVIGRGRTDLVPVVTLTTASREECEGVAAAIAHKGQLESGVAVSKYHTWFGGDEPWVLSSPVHLSVLRALESRFAVLEASARVGIGVATGRDQLYVVKSDVDVEPDRLVPLVMRDDIRHGAIVGAEHFVINTFNNDGSVVDLQQYPRLARYFSDHGTAIRDRHVAKRNPRSWFRTIDRVYPELVSKPKLLIPDISGSNQVALDRGHYHPHHNLYFVTSDVWDMEVLGAILSSRVALFFVWSYAVKMRGGYLRFQAQYLRRIRVPSLDSLTASLRRRLVTAFRRRDFPVLDALALEAYGLDDLPPFDFVDTRK
jgi:adenine-specific DNA-methyltransferase